jgi:hypothetical protein
MAGALQSAGPAGPIILALFGAVWAMVGLGFAGVSLMLWLVPIVISIGMIGLVLRRSQGLVPPPPEEGRRIGKLVGIWSGVEGVAIFVAITICNTLGHPEWIVSSICLVVGLHFFPLARGLPVRLYYVSGAILSVLGVAGLADLTPIAPSIAVALGAALVLWGTVLRILA